MVNPQSRASADYYEPDKGFSYRINGRGQNWLKDLDLMAQLDAYSVSEANFRITYLPAEGSQKTIPINMGGASRWVQVRVNVSTLLMMCGHLNRFVIAVHVMRSVVPLQCHRLLAAARCSPQDAAASSL